jgi:hypothetical protein
MLKEQKMKVDGINEPNGNAYGLLKTKPEEEEPQEPQPQEAPAVEGRQTEEDDGPGVLELLQQGHFKGVADVRLRINFADEIAALEQEQLQALTATETGSVAESIAGLVDSFVAENDLTDDQATGIAEAHTAFTEALTTAGQDPATELTDAFAQFIERLQQLMPPPEPPEPADPGTDPPQEPQPSPWQTLIDDLQAAFSTGLDALTTTLSQLEVLPPLSEPSGNGVAYDKFLAIYNQMQAQPTGQTLDEQEPTVE